MTRCKSPFCITGNDGIKGREFTPSENAQGLAESWCPSCIVMSNQIKFFSTQTALMIRTKYNEYHDTNLPREVKLILTQFTREIIGELGEEL